MAGATLVVDVLEQCAEIGELQHALAAGLMRRDQVHAELADVVAGRRPGRTHADEITIFDSSGTALEDVAAAAVYERALYAFCQTQVATVPVRQRVLFVCLHGAAKSVVAAAHFRRLAAARGLDVDAAAAGVEPDAELTPAAVKRLAGDGLSPRLGRPRPVTLYDLSAAARVVSFGCEISSAAKTERWDDVPAVGDGYDAARDRIVARVERLVSALAGR